VVFRIAWHPSEPAIVSDGNAALTVWNTATGVSRPLPGAPAPMGPMAFSHDGAQFGSASGPMLSIRDWATGTERLSTDAQVQGSCG